MQRYHIKRIILSLCVAVMVSVWPQNQVSAKAFSDLDDETVTQPGVTIYDPLEPLNRKIFWFNDKADQIVLKPIAKGYRKVVPEWGRQRVRSFLSNLNTPVNFFNAVMQGDVDQSFVSFWRFYMNTTFGVGGLFDVASLTGLPEREEDFGQTMGHYGVGSGPYLMLPLMGPSTLRDGAGRFVDSAIDPFNYVDQEFVFARLGISAIDTREGLLELVEEIREGSLDPYAAVRSMYLQNQDSKIRNGSALPSYKMKMDW